MTQMLPAHKVFLCLNPLIFLFCSMKAHVKGRAMFYQEIIPPLFVDITS